MLSGKIVLIGDGQCGKTCLLEVFKNDVFPKEYHPIVVDNFVKKVEYENGKSITLSFWDTSGQDTYETIRPLSYRATDLIFLCFSISKKESFNNIESKWVMEIKNYCPSALYILIGLKEDLRKDETLSKEELVPYDDAKKLADKIEALEYIECSALKRKNVNLVFKKSSKILFDLKQKTQSKKCGESFWCC